MFKDFSNFNDSVKTMRLTGYDAQISSLISGLKSIQSAGSSMVDAYARNYVMVQTLGSDTNGNVIDQTDAARQTAADAAIISLKRATQSLVDGATSLKRYLNSIPLPKTPATETLYSVEAGKEYLPGWIDSVSTTSEFKCQTNLDGGDALMIRKSWCIGAGVKNTDAVAVGSGVMYKHSELPWAIYQMHANFVSVDISFRSLFVVVAQVDGVWKVQFGQAASYHEQIGDSFYTFDSNGFVTGCTGDEKVTAIIDEVPHAIDDIASILPMNMSLPAQAVYALATLISLMPEVVDVPFTFAKLGGVIPVFNDFLKSGMTIKPVLVSAGNCGFIALSHNSQAPRIPAVTTNGESILSGEIIPVTNSISSLGDALVAAVVTKDIDQMNEILQSV